MLLRIRFFISIISMIEIQAKQETSKYGILSRRKRFLIFPEGSSIQLVMCHAFPNISPLGDIVLWGYTAALAFELPQDPYSPFMHHADPIHRRVDSKAIYYTDEDGKILHKVPYHRKFIVNPAFAKRSVYEALSSPQFKKGTREKFKIDRKQMHASKNKRQFLKSKHMEAASVEFHRSSRGALYQKIETMLQGLGGNNRQCLLKTLCMISQTQDDPQGAFLQEILRAVFTLPQGSSNEDYHEYDDAFSTTKPCEEVYLECDNPIENYQLPSSSL